MKTATMTISLTLAAVLSASGNAAVPDYINLIAHRGESYDAPENTLAAYRMAVERGFGFECDIYMSSDGRLFTFHDGALGRTTGGVCTQLCTEASWERTVSKVNVGGWGKWKGSKFDPTRPALFEEVLALARPGRKIYVEVKGGDEAVKWAPAIAKAIASEPKATPESVLFICFSAPTCAELKRVLPQFRVYWLTWEANAGKVLEKLKTIGADGVDIYYSDAIDEKFVKTLGAAGYEVHVWTVDDPFDAAEALARGVKTVTTNRAKYIVDCAGETDFGECAKCPNRMRINADGTKATINLARLKDDNPSEAELAARKERMRLRAEKLMRLAASVRTPGDARRPLMGWSSWNSFAVNISEEIILDTARAMATNGLAAAGYRYVNIDDGYFGGRDAQGNHKIHPQRFPNGLKPVVDGIHALGLKAGIYSDAGVDTCGSMWNDDVFGKGGGFYGHDQQDCDFFFKELDFDFIKIDYCGGQKLGLDEETRYRAIRKAIDATGKRGVRMNICRWTFPGEWAAEVAESWRVTGDIRANWKTVKIILDESIPLGGYVKSGHYNDLDMLEVGRPFGKTVSPFGDHEDGLTAEEERTHFGMWCFLSSPLLIGCDVRTMPAESISLVTNPFLLAMNQNALGAPPRLIKREGEAYTLAKDADRRHGKAKYVALYNGGDKPHCFGLQFFALDLRGKVAVFDLAERADLGEFTKVYKVEVPPHGAKFLRLDAEK